MTIRQVNQMLRDNNVDAKVVSRAGAFRFVGITEDARLRLSFRDTRVCVNEVSDLSMQGWLMAAQSLFSSSRTTTMRLLSKIDR